MKIIPNDFLYFINEMIAKTRSIQVIRQFIRRIITKYHIPLYPIKIRGNPIKNKTIFRISSFLVIFGSLASLVSVIILSLLNVYDFHNVAKIKYAIGM